MIDRMPIERAQQIVGAMVSLHLHFDIGLPLPDRYANAAATEDWLREMSLSDLVAANEIVRANDATAPDGTRTIHTICDDRLTAALYATLHYAPEPNGGHIRPACTLHDRALAIVQVDAEANLREQDDEE